MKLDIHQSKCIIVYSKEFWNETEIEIECGEEYEFVATGSWKDLVMKTDAEGYTSWYMSLYNKLKRSKENKWFALMGSLNKSDDFLIGKANQILFQKSGKLSCYANDVKGFYWNNFGEVSLTITRIK